MKALQQCDQIGQFFVFWASIQRRWQQLFNSNCSHCQAIFVKVSKSFIFLLKSFLGNFYRHLAIFTVHTAQQVHLYTLLFDRKFQLETRTRNRQLSCQNNQTVVNYDNKVFRYKNKILSQNTQGVLVLAQVLMPMPIVFANWFWYFVTKFTRQTYIDIGCD